MSVGNDVATDLARIPLLSGLGPTALTRLADASHVRTLARGRILFLEDEASEHLFLVRSGRLRVFVTSPHGEELVLSLVGPGGSLGELSVLDRRPRSASVDTVDTAEVIGVRADAVRELLDNDMVALRAVALELARGMRRVSATAADLVFLDLPRRLAKLLLAEAVAASDGSLESVPAPSQAGIAARLGVTRQSLNRAMSGFVQRGWISVDGRRVVIHNPRALRSFADS